MDAFIFIRVFLRDLGMTSDKQLRWLERNREVFSCNLVMTSDKQLRDLGWKGIGSKNVPGKYDTFPYDNPQVELVRTWHQSDWAGRISSLEFPDY